MDNKIQSRKKFIGVGVSAMALLTAFRFLIPKKKNNPKFAKMLTQDGRLVEVDIERLSVQRKQITDAQLKTWVNKEKDNTADNIK